MLPEPMIDNILKMAKMIHEDYNRNRLREHPDKPLEYPAWDDLPSDLKYSNIRQAQKIPEKLALIDCYIGGDDADAVTSFTEEEVEIMSIKEHDLWVEERESNGWVYAPVKNVERKESPYIAPWEQIPESIKEYDREPTRNIIRLVNAVGLNVCRHPRKDEAIPEFRFHKGRDAPLIISVSGHIDIRPEDAERAGESFGRLVGMLKESYPNTGIIVMTALAEGSDRIIARKAMELGLNIAPVFPFEREAYIRTFKGIGYADVAESVADFDSILSDERTYTPCVLIKRRINEVLGFRALAAYLISNSHIVVSLWNGRRSQYRGGTYDTIRMAFEGIDDDVSRYTSPRTSLSDNVENDSTHYLDSLNDALIAWIGVDRTSDDSTADIPVTSCITDDGGLPDLCFITESDEGGQGIRDRLRTRSDGTVDRRIQITDETSTLITERIPEGFDRSFRILDNMNSDIDGFGTSMDGIRDIEHLEYESASDGRRKVLTEMTERLRVMDGLSQSYRRRSRKAVDTMNVLTALYTMLFSLLILFNGSASVSIAYTLIYGITTGLLILHKKTEEHDRFVNYRAVAENIRVEYYWSIVGICDTSYDNITNYVSGGQAWMRTVMKSYSSYFVNDYASCFNIDMRDRMEYVKNSWIRERKEVSESIIEKESRKSKLYDNGNKVLSVVITVMSVISTVIVVLLLNDFSDTILTYEDSINSMEILISEFTILKIFMIILINASSLLMMRKNQLNFVEDGSMSAASMIFSKSLMKMDKTQNTSDSVIMQRNLNIIHELGLFAIGENNNWVRESERKDYRKGAKLVDVVNRRSKNSDAGNHLHDSD